MSVVLFFALVGLAIYVGVCVMKIVPATLTSLMRYRLWHIRDDLYDEIQQNKFVDKDEPLRALKEVERIIESAPGLSAANVLVVALLARGHKPEHARPADASRACPEDRAKLERVIDEYRFL